MSHVVKGKSGGVTIAMPMTAHYNREDIIVEAVRATIEAELAHGLAYPASMETVTDWHLVLLNGRSRCTQWLNRWDETPYVDFPEAWASVWQWVTEWGFHLGD